jgi:hypothetical protein
MRPLQPVGKGGNIRMNGRTRHVNKHLGWLAAAALLVSAFSAAAAEVRMPAGEFAQHGGVLAWLIDPVGRYDHHVFGEPDEAGGFQAQVGGHLMTYKLDPTAVFEDRHIRLGDLDGNGKLDAVIVRTDLSKGAALAVYELAPDGIRPLAESENAGGKHRWLNPVGILKEKGQPPLIAAVFTPHLTGSLRLFRLKDGKLEETGRLDGYTNHIFGTHNQELGRIGDVDGDGNDEIVLPNLARDKLAVIKIEDGKPKLQAAFPVDGHIVGLDRLGRETARVRLDSGKSVQIRLK